MSRARDLANRTIASAALPKAGGAMTGAITTNSTFDGIDVATDVAANTAKVSFTPDAAQVFNDTGADVDFRIESDDNANMFFVDGGEDRIGIGTAAPDYVLEVVTGGGNPPPTDGSFNGVARFQTSAGNSNALDFGLIQSGAGTEAAWIQSQAAATNGAKHNLLLNPNGGNVGIGTTSPAQKLKIVGNEQNWMCVVDQNADNGYGFAAYMGTSGGSEPAFGAFNYAGSYTFKTLSGGTTYTSDGNVSSLSDKRVKEEIKDLTDGLDILNNLKPRTFKYNGLGDMLADGRTIQGFVADEVMDVVPQYVEISKGMVGDEEVEDFKTLATGKFIPMIVKAIQELSAKNDALEAENTAMKTRMDALEARVTALEG